MSSRGTINVDLDGVVYPFWQALRDYIWTRSESSENMAPPKKVDFWDQWQMSEGEWMSLFRLGVTEGDVYRSGRPIVGAVDALWRLSDDGWNIRIVTKRLNHFRAHLPIIEATTEWLEKFNVPYRSIAFLGDEPKGDYYSSIAIDDQPSNFVPFRNNLLFDQPWNQAPPCTEETYTRVKGWSGVMKAIRESGEN